MKTEKQIEARFEEITNKLVEYTDSLNKEDITEEQKQLLAGLFASVMILGWVMDCEEEIKQISRNIKLAGALNNLEGVM